MLTSTLVENITTSAKNSKLPFLWFMMIGWSSWRQSWHWPSGNTFSRMFVGRSYCIENCFGSLSGASWCVSCLYLWTKWNARGELRLKLSIIFWWLEKPSSFITSFPDLPKASNYFISRLVNDSLILNVFNKDLRIQVTKQKRERSVPFHPWELTNWLIHFQELSSSKRD